MIARIGWKGDEPVSVSRIQAGGILGLVTATAAIDQLVKGLVVGALHLNESRPLIPGVLDLSYRQNHGVAFSALPHASAYLLVALNLLVIALFIGFMLPQLQQRSARIALALVCGGAVGNLIDRIRLGYVIDYLDFHFWPVFNLADTAIVIGVGLLLINHLFFHHPVPKS